MGWIVHHPKGHDVKVISHDGGAPEFFVRVSLLPEQNLAIVFLVNAISYTRLDILQLAHNVTSILLNKPLRTLPVDWPVTGATWALLLLPIVQLMGLWRTLWLVRKWRSGNSPKPSWVRWVFLWGMPLIAHLAVAAVTLWLLPRSFDLSLSRLLVFVPDYGCLAAFSGGFALVWGIVRSVVVGRWLLGHEQTPIRSVAAGDGTC